MSAERHVITYPGFAEGKDAKRLFPDIRDVYADRYEFHILPFYEELPSGDRLIHSITEHAQTIQAYMDNLDGEIIMLAKCGGSRPAISMDNEHIDRLSKLCLINPPSRASNEYLGLQFQGWGGKERPDGSWTIPRGWLGNYVVSKEYMNDATTSDTIARCNEITQATDTDLYIVRSLKDEVFTPIRAEKINSATTIDIAGGDHHLLDKTIRQQMIGALALHGIL